MYTVITLGDCSLNPRNQNNPYQGRGGRGDGSLGQGRFKSAVADGIHQLETNTTTNLADHPVYHLRPTARHPYHHHQSPLDSKFDNHINQLKTRVLQELVAIIMQINSLELTIISE